MVPMRSLWILALAALVTFAGCISAPVDENGADADETPDPEPVLRNQNETLHQDVETQVHPTEQAVAPGWTLTFPDTLQTLDVTLRWTQNANEFRLHVATPDGAAQTYSESGGTVTIDFDAPAGGTYRFTPRALGPVLEDTLTLEVSYAWLQSPSTDAPQVTPAISVRQEGDQWIAEVVLQGRSTVDDEVDLEVDVLNGA
ncbi:MAG TPA: hypothetical protein VGB42_00640, partial [Candidatus Thermoplasmatota archaeon]